MVGKLDLGMKTNSQNHKSEKFVLFQREWQI